MITLTDGKKTVTLTKAEMETIEDGLREIDGEYYGKEVRAIFAKLRGLDYE